MDGFVDKFDIERMYNPGDWQRILFSDFATTLLSNERPFPCVFGVAGLRANQLRFVFADPLEARTLAPVLARYVQAARGIGGNTSLVLMTRPGPVRGMESYRTQFWGLLRDLAAVDKHPWPADIPEALDTANWEFCFAGEPIFVVCATPAHVLRQSRRSTSMMLTFQPRWVFDHILGSEAAARSSTAKVRSRLAAFDFVPAAPALGQYGDPDNREYAQYFLDDDNNDDVASGQAQCPFHTIAKKAPKERAA